MTTHDNVRSHLICFSPEAAQATFLLRSIAQCGHGHFDFARAETVNAAFEASRETPYAGVLLDARNGGYAKGLAAEILEKLSLPIVAVTAEDVSEDDVLDLIGGGVHEFLSVDELDGCLLTARFRRAAARLAASNKEHGHTRAGHAAAAVLARLPMAVIMVDPSGKILLANPQGERLLAKRDGIGVDAGGVVRASKVTDSRQLADLILKCAAGSIDETDGALSLERPSQSAPLGVLVTPLGKSVGRRGAALFVSEPEAPVEIPAEVLGRLYGFSPAESRLVLWLLQGLRIEEAAAQIGVSPNTARYQLKQIFRKTDTSRQAELVKLILTGPAVLNPASPAAAEKSGIRRAS